MFIKAEFVPAPYWKLERIFPTFFGRDDGYVRIPIVRTTTGVVKTIDIYNHHHSCF